MGLEIPNAKNLEEAVFNITNEKEFEQIVFDVFAYQYATNQVYKTYCDAVRKTPANVDLIERIPFLPIQFFKKYPIVSGAFKAEIVFKSSGTTSENRSEHLIKDVAVYKRSFVSCFQNFYGNPADYCIVGLLPSYIENGDSSLVFMVDELIKQSNHPLSGFYLYDVEKLHQTALQLEKARKKSILFGVSYALLDFSETFPMPLHYITIIETGGMKGRKKELIKAQFYLQLQNAFSLKEIHSEYGMTELLSQAYAINGLYKTPPWMKILLRDETDPFSLAQRSGIINVIDLANIHSCSFIATDDLGKLHADGSFEVLGRVDNSDIRGCSQLVL